MSARREARARRHALAPAKDGLPAAFALGPCIEVWADPTDTAYMSQTDGHLTANWWSARRRYREARTAWLDSIGVLETADRCRVFPVAGCRPWQADYLVDNGRADDVAERFAAAGCTSNDIPELRAEAVRLSNLADRKARR